MKCPFVMRGHQAVSVTHDRRALMSLPIRWATPWRWG